MRSACALSVCNSADGRFLPWVALAIGLAAIGHLFWEAAQLPLYTLWRTGTPREILFALFHCTGGDILITTLTLAAADRAGAVFQVDSVRLADGFYRHRPWRRLHHVQRMAQCRNPAQLVLYRSDAGSAFLGTGLTPLLQWLIVPTLALAIVGCRYRRARRLTNKI